MKTEYILYLTVIVIAMSFIVLLFMLAQDTKKNMVNGKIRKCIEDKIHQQVSAQNVEEMIKYIEKNRKYLLFTTYKNSIHTLRRALVRINY